MALQSIFPSAQEACGFIGIDNNKKGCANTCTAFFDRHQKRGPLLVVTPRPWLAILFLPRPMGEVAREA